MSIILWSMALVAGVVALLWVAPVLLHPVMYWHLWVLKHEQIQEPVGFADWDVLCECGKRAEL